MVFHSDFPLPLNRSIIQAIKCKPVSYILIFWPSPLFLKIFAIEVNSSGKEEEENFSNRIFVFMTFVSSVEEGENRGESSAPFGIMAALKDLSYTLSLSFSLSYKLTHTRTLSHTHTLSLHLNTGPGGVRLLRLNQTNSISSFESFLRLPRFQHQHFRLKSRLPGAAAAAAAARGRLLPPDCPTGPPTTFRAETTTKADDEEEQKKRKTSSKKL